MEDLVRTNLLLVTYDSCRFDVLREAQTPVLDSFVEVVPAQTPANFTYAAHLAFFAGILPHVLEDVPYYNRYRKQLLGVLKVGETPVARDALIGVESRDDFVCGFRAAGHQTVGAAAMNWFRQSGLTRGFERFAFTGTDADAQIDFVLENLDLTRPYFAFINFGETHYPFKYKGKAGACNEYVQAQRMARPPVAYGPVGPANPGYHAQREAAEFLDSRLPRLFSSLAQDTIVIVCADHGECFGEDGFWGHTVNHPKVLEVPLGIFRLDGAKIG